jgi:alanine dehydrogenase
MIIGVPKEIKNNENRVALTPAGAQELVKRGHTVHVQKNAGADSGFSDEEYVKAGAKITATAEEVFSLAEMIIKVKEPIEQEYKLIKKGIYLLPFCVIRATHESNDRVWRCVFGIRNG